MQQPVLSFEIDLNPPAPCGAGLEAKERDMQDVAFKSTRPLRGGTGVFGVSLAPVRFKSTRPLRGGTPAVHLLLDVVDI